MIYYGYAFIIIFLGQFGDLHESLVKRQLNIKDSSNCSTVLGPIIGAVTTGL